jgi:hypothetical protein
VDREVHLAPATDVGSARNSSKRFYSYVHLVNLCPIADHAVDDHAGPTVARHQTGHDIAKQRTPLQTAGVDDEHLSISGLIDQDAKRADPIRVARRADVARKSASQAESHKGKLAYLRAIAGVAKIGCFEAHAHMVDARSCERIAHSAIAPMPSEHSCL